MGTGRGESAISIEAHIQDTHYLLSMASVINAMSYQQDIAAKLGGGLTDGNHSCLSDVDVFN